MKRSFYRSFGKGWIDASLAFAGIILVSPILLVAAIATRLSSPGPVFFRQVRIGQFGKPFCILKFRTMVDSVNLRGACVTTESDPRVTPVGRWLRKTKIDELPQLINVLAGRMSLVGPRPEVPQYTAAYSERQKRVFLAKPGVTGPAAIAYVQEEEILGGRLERERVYVTTVLPAKLEIDLAYCENIRFLEDLKLIFITVTRIVVTWKPQQVQQKSKSSVIRA